MKFSMINSNILLKKTCIIEPVNMAHFIVHCFVFVNGFEISKKIPFSSWN